jgi:DnaJ-class molecular chaperone
MRRAAVSCPSCRGSGEGFTVVTAEGIRIEPCCRCKGEGQLRAYFLGESAELPGKEDASPQA